MQTLSPELQLVVYLHQAQSEPGATSSLIELWMQNHGYSEAQIIRAWMDARKVGYTASAGLGRERLTERGRALARELTRQFALRHH